MSLITYDFDLNITPGAIPPILKLSQYDDSRTYVAHLKDDNGAAFTLPEGATATLHGVNCKRVAFDIEATVSGADVTFTPKEAATDQPGKIHATLCIKSGSEQLTPLLIMLDVQKDGATKEDIARSPGFTDAIKDAVMDYIRTEGIGVVRYDQAQNLTEKQKETARENIGGGTGSNGQLWTAQQVYLLRQVLSNLKYDDAAAGNVAEELLTSLESNTEDQGWSRAQIDLLDALLDYVKFTDETGGTIADKLIASLRGQIIEPSGSVTISANGTYDVADYASAVVDTPTYADGDEVSY